jgi:hypothetical protein
MATIFIFVRTLMNGMGTVCLHINRIFGRIPGICFYQYPVSGRIPDIKIPDYPVYPYCSLLFKLLSLYRVSVPFSVTYLT